MSTTATKTKEARQAKAAARRAMLNDLARQMELAMTMSSEVLGAVESVAATNGYSARNAALIVGQCGQATVVKSFKAWTEAGRQVRKGEKALYILAPTKKRQAQGDEQGEAGTETAPEEPATQAEGDTEGKKSRPIPYVCVPVFDVSQTDEADSDQAESQD